MGIATEDSSVIAQPHPKMKRPPPSSTQSAVNGVKSSRSSPSPSLSSKRPPAGIKHPPVPASTVGSSINGAGPRLSGRPRRESQRPGDVHTKQGKFIGRGASVDGMGLDRKSVKRLPEPLAIEVKTTSYILKKHRKSSPSLLLHLHPTHFRFDQQDGSFGYNSPMRVILEHIRSQTIPHDMLEELFASNVKFYDGCLIVQIVDHRSVSDSSQNPSSNTANGEKSIPFSIHNYNQHLIPSPYVPYPSPPQSDSAGDDATNGSVKSSVAAEASADTDEIADPEAEKENIAAAEKSSEGSPKRSVNTPKVYTTVLHPTELSLQAELTIFATSPDPRVARRQSQALNSNRTPASATTPHSLTPLSALPQTPASGGGSLAKRQKMSLDSKDLHEFESKLIATTASPLYLEPVASFQDAQKVLGMLKHPLHQSKPPSPKSRKRTIAELAADEALAAEEERFMLLMDERLAPALSNAAAGAKSAAADGQPGAASFEPRFSRFKALENIKIQHKEKAKREHEKKMQQDHAKRLQQEQMELDRRREFEEKANQERALRERHARQMQQAKFAQAQQQQQQQITAQNQQAHAQQNGIIPTPQQQQQQMLQASQGQHSSPIVRHQTPHGSSPLVGQIGVSHPGQSVPMNITSSNQGAGSPVRPGSALQHPHPGVAAAMAQQTSQRSSQQAPSRHGTPQMPQGTPSIQQATPVTRHVTPTPRMSHASPAGSTVAHTPVMAHNMMGTPHMNSVQQTQQAMLVRQQQQQQALHHQQQQQLHASPNNQMSPAAVQQLAAQTYAGQSSPQQLQHQMYMQQMQRQTQQQMANLQAQAQAQAQAQQQTVHQQQQQQQQQQQRQQQGMQVLPNGASNPNQNPNAPINASFTQQQQHLMQQRFAQLMASLNQKFGGNPIPPQMIQQARKLAAQQVQQFQQRQILQHAQQAQNGGAMMQGLGGGMQGQGQGQGQGMGRGMGM